MSPLRLELPAPVTGRIKVLDELKGVAIILVILYHVGGVLSWANGPHGEAGVDMFVILSGIGLTLSSTDGGRGPVPRAEVLADLPGVLDRADGGPPGQRARHEEILHPGRRALSTTPESRRGSATATR